MFGWDDFGEDGKRRENGWEGYLVGRGRRRENWWGLAIFPQAHQNLISTKWRENVREKGEVCFGHSFPSPNN